MKKSYRYILSVLTVVVIASTCLAQEENVAEAETFTFAPTDSLRYATAIMTAHARLADGQVGLVDTTMAFYQNQYLASPVGFDLQSWPDSISSTRDGKPLDSPISDAMAKTPYTLVLDDDGHAMSTEGLGKLLENLKVDDSSLRADLIANINPAAMSAKMAAEWNSIIDPIVGQKLAVGVINHIQEVYLYGSQTKLEFFTRVEVADTFRVEEKKCARLFLHCDSDLTRLAKRRDIKVEELLQAYGLTAEDLPDSPDAASSMRVVQIVMEVETMKLLGVQSHIQITLRAPDDDKGEHELQLAEIKNYRFVYDNEKK